MAKPNPITQPQVDSQSHIPAFSVVQGRHPLLPASIIAPGFVHGGSEQDRHAPAIPTHTATSKTSRPYFVPIFYQVPSLPPAELVKRLAEHEITAQGIPYRYLSHTAPVHHKRHKTIQSVSTTHEILPVQDTDEQTYFQRSAKERKSRHATSDENFKYHYQFDDRSNIQASERPRRCQICPYMCFAERDLQIHSWRYHNKSFDHSDLMQSRTGDSSQSIFMKAAEEHEANQMQITPPTKSDTDCMPHGTAGKTEDVSYPHNPTLCTTCRVPLPSTDKISNHVCFEIVVHRCTSCNFTTDDSDEMTKHIAESLHKKTVAAFKCSKCLKSYSNQWHLKMHIRKHIWSKSHKCEVCGRGFSERWYLKSHLKTHKSKVSVPVSTSATLSTVHAQKGITASMPTTKVPSEETASIRDKVFTCQLCSQVYSNPQCLDKHVSTHHDQDVSQSSSQKKILIPKCPTQPKSTRVGDTRRILSISNLYPCPICRIIYMTEDERQSHLVSFHKVFPTVLQFTHNQPQPTPSSSVSSHREKARKSTLSAAKLDTSSTVAKRAKTKHSCTLCERTFAEVWHLRRHMTSHMNKMKDSDSSARDQKKPAVAKTEKPKQKEKTDTDHKGSVSHLRKRKCTSLLESLEDRHGKKKRKSLSEGVFILKPHMCKVCDRTFAEWWNLKRHMQSHEKVDEGVHLDGDIATVSKVSTQDVAVSGNVCACKLCPRTFPEWWQLKRHMQSHRNDVALLWTDLVLYSHATGVLFVPDSICRDYSIDLLMHSQLMLKNLETVAEDPGPSYRILAGHVVDSITCSDQNQRKNQGVDSSLQKSMAEGQLRTANDKSKKTYLSQLGLAKISEEKDTKTSNFDQTSTYSTVSIHRAGLDPYTTLSQQTILAEENGLLVRRDSKHIKTVFMTNQAVLGNESEKPKVPPPENDTNDSTMKRDRKKKRTGFSVKKSTKRDQSSCLRLDSHYTFERSQYESDLKLSREKDTGMYRCYFCDKNFHQPFHLKIHIRTHTGDRPYSCNYCTYSGTQVASIRSHLKSKHKNVAYTIITRKSKSKGLADDESLSSAEEQTESNREAKHAKNTDEMKSSINAASDPYDVKAHRQDEQEVKPERSAVLCKADVTGKTLDTQTESLGDLLQPKVLEVKCVQGVAGVITVSETKKNLSSGSHESLLFTSSAVHQCIAEPQSSAEPFVENSGSLPRVVTPLSENNTITPESDAPIPIMTQNMAKSVTPSIDDCHEALCLSKDRSTVSVAEVIEDENNNLPVPLNLVTSRESRPNKPTRFTGHFDPYHIVNTFQAHVGNQLSLPIYSHLFFRDIFESHASTIKSMYLQPLDLSMPKMQPQSSCDRELPLDLSANVSTQTTIEGSRLSTVEEAKLSTETKNAPETPLSVHNQCSKIQPGYPTSALSSCLDLRACVAGENPGIVGFTDMSGRHLHGKGLIQQSSVDRKYDQVSDRFVTRAFHTNWRDDDRKVSHISDTTQCSTNCSSLCLQASFHPNHHAVTPSLNEDISSDTQTANQSQFEDLRTTEVTENIHGDDARHLGDNAQVETDIQKSRESTGVIANPQSSMCSETSLQKPEDAEDGMKSQTEISMLKKAEGEVSDDCTSFHRDEDSTSKVMLMPSDEDEAMDTRNHGDDDKTGFTATKDEDEDKHTCGGQVSDEEMEVDGIQNVFPVDGNDSFGFTEGIQEEPINSVVAKREDEDNCTKEEQSSGSMINELNNNYYSPAEYLKPGEENDVHPVGISYADTTGKLHDSTQIIQDVYPIGISYADTGRKLGESNQLNQEETNHLIHKKMEEEKEEKRFLSGNSYPIRIHQPNKSEYPISECESSVIDPDNTQTHSLDCFDGSGNYVGEPSAFKRLVPVTSDAVVQAYGMKHTGSHHDNTDMDTDIAPSDILVADDGDDSEVKTEKVSPKLSASNSYDFEKYVKGSIMQEHKACTRISDGDFSPRWFTCGQSKNESSTLESVGDTKLSQANSTSSSACDTEFLGNIEELRKVISLTSRCVSQPRILYSRDPYFRRYSQWSQTTMPSYCTMTNQPWRKFTPLCVPPVIHLPTSDNFRVDSTTVIRKGKSSGSQQGPVKIAPKPRRQFAASSPISGQNQQITEVIAPPFRAWPPMETVRSHVTAASANTLTYTKNTKISPGDKIFIVWSRSRPEPNKKSIENAQPRWATGEEMYRTASTSRENMQIVWSGIKSECNTNIDKRSPRLYNINAMATDDTTTSSSKVTMYSKSEQPTDTGIPQPQICDVNYPLLPIPTYPADRVKVCATKTVAKAQVPLTPIVPLATSPMPHTMFTSVSDAIIQTQCSTTKTPMSLPWSGCGTSLSLPSTTSTATHNASCSGSVSSSSRHVVSHPSERAYEHDHSYTSKHSAYESPKIIPNLP
ncbi:uncharacterized protein [Ptychodera flava]|uniref:uncharacterized protein isoform X2 n=1 Tax=Ptychodera flava TaxID=63121 RepID=UPI00396A65C8